MVHEARASEFTSPRWGTSAYLPDNGAPPAACDVNFCLSTTTHLRSHAYVDRTPFDQATAANDPPCSEVVTAWFAVNLLTVAASWALSPAKVRDAAVVSSTMAAFCCVIMSI